MLAGREHFIQFARLLSDPLLLLDGGAQIHAANRSALDRFAAVEGKLEGRFLWDVVLDDRARVEQFVKRCARTRTPTPSALVLKGSAGEGVEYRVEGGRCAPANEPAAVLLRLIPKESANQAFLILNRQIREIGESQRALALKTSVIEQQRREILQLASTIIEIWDDILLVPLHRDLTEEAIMYLIQKLLCRIVDMQASWVIVDLTGIEHLEPTSADSLTKMAKAVKLIGSRCVLTGLSPKLAASLPESGISLDVSRVTRSLRDALYHCVDFRGQKQMRARRA